MARGLRVAHRLRLAREYLGWMSIHAPRVPLLADSIAKAAQDLEKVEATLRTSKHKKPASEYTDVILRPVEQQLLTLLANVEAQLWTPTRRRASEDAGALSNGSSLEENARQRIALIESDVVRLRSIATHPSARDVLGWATAALADARRQLCGDMNLERVERIESDLDMAAWRVRVVEDAVDRFGPAAIIEIVERRCRR